MSIKAMHWALQQATGDPRTQCLLYVIADCASIDGVCWPSANHMADKSQQSRATVYRRLAELRDMGLLETFERWIDDDGKIHFAKAPGRRPTSPEIRLNFAAEVQRERARRSSSGSDDDHGDDETPVAGSDSGVSHECDEGLSQGGDGAVADVRQGLSHCCDDNSNSNQESNQEESPQAPQRGVIEPPLEEFQKAYPIPFTDFERTKSAWQAMTETERREAITGANGYGMLCKQQPKRNVEDAHRWLRGRKWQGYLTAGKQAEAIAQRVDVTEGSEKWQAWTIFYQACGKRTGIPDFQIRGSSPDRVANVPMEWPPVGRGLDPDRSTWKTHIEGGGQFAAALRKLQECPNAPIQFGQHIEGGRYLRTLTVPFEWPPGKSAAA